MSGLAKISSRVKDGMELGLAKPLDQRSRLDGVSLGKDKKGFFVYTHRARCHSYNSPAKIPDGRVKFIRSTG